MLLLSLNAVLAALCAHYAQRSAARARAFLGPGYVLIRDRVQRHPKDFRHDIFARRDISIGGQYLIGGIAWATMTLLFVGGTLFFSFEALNLLL